MKRSTKSLTLKTESPHSSDVVSNRPLRILICRLSHIGDCLLSLPLLPAIRKAYPTAFIAWAVEKPTHTLYLIVSPHFLIDQMIPSDRKKLTLG